MLPQFNFLPMPFFSYIDQYSDITDVLLRDQKRFAHTDAFTDISRHHFSISDRKRRGSPEHYVCKGIG
ncbi:MAG: hypothetical protein AAF135_20745, partial [Bacteroidota bacterium]